jgi:cyclomaltodextrinase
MSDGWVDHVIWWHVYPLGFAGAEPAAGPGQAVTHRLGHLEAWLDHLIGLGCNGLALGPVFASGTHGYDTVDYFRIDPRLGDESDFDALVKACRERGVRVLLDGVFNHAGREFEPVRRAIEAGSGEWVRWSGEYPYLFEGHDRLVTLNHESEQVRDFVADVMVHWLERGADGWRLDAAYAVAPEFWAGVLPRVRERFPDAWFVGEMIHGDYRDYVHRSGLDAVTQYELWKAIWSSLNDRNLFELAWALDRHRDVAGDFLPLTFLGNHDVTRIASQVADPRHVGHAVALLFFLPGVPSVYYGDEFGFRAVKEDRPGGDDAVRPPMPARPEEITDPGFTALYRELIGVRRRNPWLTRATITTEQLANEHVVVTAEGDGRRMTLALNLGDEAFHHTHGSIGPHAWALHE